MLNETFKQLISNYILAKDTNRPWHMQHAFEADAVLEMELLTSNIEFPAHVEGRQAISETLVSNFGKTFENVYTFCLEDSVDQSASLLTCDWLVFMTDKEGTGLKAGWGTYEWRFSGSENGALTQRLKIKIEQMEILPLALVDAVYRQVTELSYPWTTASAVADKIAAINALSDLSAYLNRATWS
ncbi:hypothetical protein [Marinobacterium lutimaris]|uniref:Uncharacterized protein n=1 Tax=Marinobacterium lutimaris TaxID=568106 RepID=A0A1H5Y1Z5_9GAMM|nr:hypothetical protein [Marinobacterium lutimaris]SEG17566.1 hypothetical protein SAMN05444390_1011573 [Marinobacterium lutimaris]